MLVLRTHQKSLPLQLFILEMNNFSCPLWNLQEVTTFNPPPPVSPTAAFPRGATLLAACVSSQVAWAQAIACMCIHSYLCICSHTLSDSACPVEMVPCWSDNWWTILPATPSCSLTGRLGFPSPALTRSAIYKHQGEREHLAHVRSVITVREVSCLSAQRASASFCLMCCAGADNPKHKINTSLLETPRPLKVLATTAVGLFFMWAACQNTSHSASTSRPSTTEVFHLSTEAAARLQGEGGRTRKKVTPNRKITQRLRSASDRHLWSAREAKWCCGSGDAHQRWPQDCPDRSGMQRPGPPRRSLPKTRHLPRGRIPGSWGKSREVRTLPGAPLSHSNKYISQRETEEENEAGASDQQVPMRQFPLSKLPKLNNWGIAALKAWASWDGLHLWLVLSF